MSMDLLPDEAPAPRATKGIRARFEAYIRRNYWYHGGLDHPEYGVMSFDTHTGTYDNQFTQDMYAMFCAGFRSRSAKPLENRS